ncbi:MAG: DUF397 domain-containing protein [Actinobacteria bacterium]|nr:DUF397 domain-containing protein [Actinomycetota bacterium]
MFASELSTARWRKSSRSSDTSNCVEVASTGPAVAVRDSKHPTGGALIVTPRAWNAFTTALRDGELG